jgi:DNA (cytosine-5)-methyltransferase 1
MFNTDSLAAPLTPQRDSSPIAHSQVKPVRKKNTPRKKPTSHDVLPPLGEQLPLAAGAVLCGDFFAGAGGLTTGMVQAATELGLPIDLVAVNHWPTAVGTHFDNHQQVRHYCEDVGSVWPTKVVPGGKLHFAAFAPECPHHSNARGSKPMNEQSRATAWHVIRWAEALDIECILVENVEEFMDWGPLWPADHPDEKLAGRPIKNRKGEFFGEWVRALRRRGYKKIEYRVINSAYYGAATARPRFFLQAKKRGTITWPQATHAPRADIQPSLFNDVLPFRGAEEIIDWSVPGESIFDRAKPLCYNTMRRIFVGVEKFAGLGFLIPYYSERDGQTPRVHSLSEPMPTVCGQPRHALCRPYLVVLRNNAHARSIDLPIPTICAEARNHFYLAQPFFTQYYGGKDAVSIEKPLGTITANYEHYALTQPVIASGAPLEPCLVSYKGNDTVKSLNDPLGTQTSHDRFALMRPFLSSMEHTSIESGDTRRVREVALPLPTVTGRAAWGLISPTVLPPFGLPPEGVYRGNPPRSVEQPLQTVTASRGGGHLLQPFVVRYNGNSDVASLLEPLPTITNRDRFGLVHPMLLPMLVEQHDGDVEVIGVLDILYRMLLKRELAAAMGFPKTYTFRGTDTDIKRQIGNAVEVNTACALSREILRPYAEKYHAKAQRKSRNRVRRESGATQTPGELANTGGVATSAA